MIVARGCLSRDPKILHVGARRKEPTLRLEISRKLHLWLQAEVPECAELRPVLARKPRLAIRAALIQHLSHECTT